MDQGGELKSYVDQVSEQIKRDYEIGIFFGSLGRYAYACSMNERDRPRGTAKIRGKRRKSKKVRDTLWRTRVFEGMGLDGILKDRP